MSEIGREDALDCALSGQSYTERLIDSVCAELNAMAIELRISHTVDGSWPSSERDTLAKHDHLRRMAVELRKLDILPRQAARAQGGNGTGVVSEAITTDDDVERVAKLAGWDNRKWMTPADYSIWCERMREFVRLTTAPTAPAADGGGLLERVADEVFADEFSHWWDEHGQFVRSGGGNYERTFAFEAWRYLYPKTLATHLHSGEQGGEAVAWLWVKNGLRTPVPKDYADELIKDGEIVQPLYAHPAPSVPEGNNCRHFYVTDSHSSGHYCVSCGITKLEYPFILSGDYRKDVESLVRTIKMLTTTTPQPADGWNVASSITGDLPEIGVPVIGHNPAWVDGDFNPKGIRECFRFGDGSEWNSAYWLDGQDCYATSDGAPTLWKHYPNPPEQGAE